jgi:hypothetical protein
MKNKILIVLSIILFFSCEKEVEYNEQKEVVDSGTVFEAVVPPTTKTITQEVLENNEIEIDTASSTVGMSEDLFTSLKLDTGDVLVSQEGEGDLLKIQEVKREGGKVELVTREATLEETFDDLDISFLTPADLSNVEEVTPLDEGVAYCYQTKSTKKSSDLSFTVNTLLTDKKKDFKFSINGDFKFYSDIRTNLKIKKKRWHLPKLMNFGVNYKGYVEADLTTQLSLEKELDEGTVFGKPVKLQKRLAKIKLRRKVIMAGSVPILISPRIIIEAGVRLASAASFEGGVYGKVGFEAGVNYVRGDGWNTGVNIIKKFNVIKPSGEIEVKAEVFISARYEYKIYKKLSPFLEAEFRGGVRAGAQVNPNRFYYDLYAGADVNIGAYMKIFKVKLLNINKGLYNKEWYFNVAPEKPKNPFPADEKKINFSSNPEVNWECIDYNKNDATLKYRVYASTDKDKIKDGLQNTTYVTNKSIELKEFNIGDHVYWQVEAIDSKGKTKLGPVWSFINGEILPATEIPRFITSDKAIIPNAPVFKLSYDNKGDDQNKMAFRVGKVGGDKKLIGPDDYKVLNYDSENKIYELQFLLPLHENSTYECIPQNGWEDQGDEITFETTAYTNPILNTLSPIDLEETAATNTVLKAEIIKGNSTLSNYSIDIFVGATVDEMEKVATKTGTTNLSIEHKLENIEYSSMYYWQMRGTINGKEVRTSIKSFSTLAEGLGLMVDKTGRKFKTVTIGNRTWLAEDYTTDQLNNEILFDLSANLSHIKSSIPDGWHIANPGDFEDLAEYVVSQDYDFNILVMSKSNTTKFSAITTFVEYADFAYFWMLDGNDIKLEVLDTSDGLYPEEISSGKKAYVRLVKDN